MASQAKSTVARAFHSFTAVMVIQPAVRTAPNPSPSRGNVFGSPCSRRTAQRCPGASPSSGRRPIITSWPPLAIQRTSMLCTPLMYSRGSGFAVTGTSVHATIQGVSVRAPSTVVGAWQDQQRGLVQKRALPRAGPPLPRYRCAFRAYFPAGIRPWEHVCCLIGCCGVSPDVFSSATRFCAAARYSDFSNSLSSRS